MKSPARHRFTVEEYYRMAETGVLARGARVELLDGVIHDMSPIGLLHAGIVNRLDRLFNASAKGRWLVWGQSPARLSSYWEPEPDLQLLKPSPDDYLKHPAAPDDVLLLIEVADSSLASDRKHKLPVYARFGIVEVWIVNLPDRAIEVYREPHPTAYGSKTILHSGDKAAPAAFPDAIVDIAALFRT
jgi:Uma2 family endonuclease